VLYGRSKDSVLVGGSGRDRSVDQSLNHRDDTIVNFHLTEDILNLGRFFNPDLYNGEHPTPDYLQFQQTHQGAVMHSDSYADLQNANFQKLITLSGVNIGNEI
jgi:Ca2+-binding RTX toxin-like protein